MLGLRLIVRLQFCFLDVKAKMLSLWGRKPFPAAAILEKEMVIIRKTIGRTENCIEIFFVANYILYNFGLNFFITQK